MLFKMYIYLQYTAHCHYTYSGGTCAPSFWRTHCRIIQINLFEINIYTEGALHWGRGETNREKIKNNCHKMIVENECCTKQLDLFVEI